VKPENLALRLAEMKARLRSERLAPARRVRAIASNNSARAAEQSRDSALQLRRPRGGVELSAWLASQSKRKNEGYEFRDMGRKITRQSRELRRERYVTAMLGVRTSWPRILENAKYVIHGGTA
jgi:hypothetical protein